MNSIESMTRHVMVRSGLDAEELPLLVHAALNGHGPSRRLLERAVSAEISIVVPGQSGLCPIEYATGRYRTDGTMFANIRIGDYLWTGDSLIGRLPETLRLGIAGRPLRDIVDIDFIPREAIARAGSADGTLVEFDRMTTDMPTPSLRRRIAWLPRRWGLFVAEGMVDGPKPAWMLSVMGGMALATALLCAMRLSDADWRPWDWLPVAMLAGATLNGAWFVANGMRPRQFSLLQAWMAQSRHRPEA